MANVSHFQHTFVSQFPVTDHQRKLFKDLRVDLCSSVIHNRNCILKPISFLHRKHSVNWGHYSPPLSAIELKDVSVRLIQSELVSQSDLVSLSVRLSWYISQT